MTILKNDHRKVLLTDRDPIKRQLRAVALRNSEIEVHAVSNIADACRLCKSQPYDLVLLAAEEDSEEVALLCSELKKSKPRQRIALLVGAPQFVREIGCKARDEQSANESLAPRLVIGPTPGQPTRWHLMMERLLAAGFFEQRGGKVLNPGDFTR